MRTGGAIDRPLDPPWSNRDLTPKPALASR